MINDPIVEEVHRIRQAYFAKFNYDLDAIYKDLKEQEEKSGRRLVSFYRKKTEASKTKRPTAS